MRRGEERGTSVLVFLINSAALTALSSREIELFGTKKESDTQFHSVHIKHQFELENDTIFQVDKIQYFRFIKTT